MNSVRHLFAIALLTVHHCIPTKRSAFMFNYRKLGQINRETAISWWQNGVRETLVKRLVLRPIPVSVGLVSRANRFSGPSLKVLFGSERKTRPTNIGSQTDSVSSAAGISLGINHFCFGSWRWAKAAGVKRHIWYSAGVRQWPRNGEHAKLFQCFRITLYRYSKSDEPSLRLPPVHR